MATVEKLEPAEVMIKAAGAADREGVLRAFRPYSSHPGDWYLTVVLVERNAHAYVAPFAVWTHNAQAGGLYEGIYCKTLDEALVAFATRKGMVGRVQEVDRQEEE